MIFNHLYYYKNKYRNQNKNFIIIFLSLLITKKILYKINNYNHNKIIIKK